MVWKHRIERHIVPSRAGDQRRVIVTECSRNQDLEQQTNIVSRPAMSMFSRESRFQSQEPSDYASLTFFLLTQPLAL